MTVYRTPDSDCSLFLSTLEKCILQLMFRSQHKSKHMAIAGDFNIDVLNLHKPDTQAFLDILRSFNLYCTNNKPTRNLSCLDNIVTNFPLDQCSSSLLEEGILSDHAGVFTKIKSILRSSLITVDSDQGSNINFTRLLTQPRLENLNASLYHFDWSDLYVQNDIDIAVDYFMNTVTNFYNYFCPKIKGTKHRKKGKKTSKKWFTPKLRQMRKTLLSLYDIWKSSNSEVDSSRFKQFKKWYRKAISEEKILANSNLIANAKNKCKAAWEVIKKESGEVKKHVNIPLPPNILNDYFINVPNSVSSQITSSNSNNVTYIDFLNNFELPECISKGQNFKWKAVDAATVESIGSRLSSSKSNDIFGLSNYVLKNIISSITLPLTHLINLILINGKFPQSLKQVKVTPVFKKGERNSPECYRPIAIVPIVSKIIQSCMLEQLYNYFVTNKLIYTHQYGFRPNHSTTMAIETIVNHILENFENKLVVGSCLIDLTKAFDCICHSILSNKLSFYGIKGKELGLIESYLQDRLQMVEVNGTKSDFKRVIAGVPQGSVLGPFLFLVFVNDFHCNIPNCLSVLYADDTTLLNSQLNLSDAKNQIQQSMSIANLWFQANKLSVNKSKTENMYFTLKNTEEQLPSSVKLLGITLDAKLTWEAHVVNVCKRLSRVVYLLRKLRDCVSAEVLVTTYYGLFHSILTYGIRLWGNSSQSLSAFIWQKKAIRTIASLTERESCKNSFIKFEILTLPSIYILSNLLFVKNNIGKFKSLRDTHHHDTRHKDELLTPQLRLNKTINSHCYQQIKMFNKLPQAIRLLPQPSFKIRLCKWLKSKAFYSVPEFFNCNMSDL